MAAKSIISARLELVPLSAEFMRAALAREWMEAARMLQVMQPGEWPDWDDVLALRLRQIEEDAAVAPWLLRAMVLRESRELVGHIGFHTAPGAEYLAPYSPRAVEFGYTVLSPFRRQGFAYEASVALMKWAHDVHAVDRFIVSVGVVNAPSLALAAKLGFVRIGSHMDEVDGEEEVMECRWGELID